MLHNVLQVHEEQCTLRTPELHHQQCAEVQEDASKSKEYGINTSSVLNELKYFHTCTGALIPDIMHDVLEGGLQYEVKLMLYRFVHEEKHFTINYLNYKLENYDYGYMDVKNRPSSISANTLNSSDNSLKQNGKSSVTGVKTSLNK